MRITKLSLRNFLSFGNESQELTFDPLATIVGPNDSGKTNIFRALTLLGELLRVPGLDLRPYFHRGDTDQQLEVRADLQFNEWEIQALTDFLVCSALMNEPTPQNPNESELVAKLKEELVKGTGRRIYEGVFARTTLQVVGSWPLNQRLEVQLRVAIDGHELFIDRPGVLHIHPSLVYAYSSTNLNHVFKEGMRASGISLDGMKSASILPFVDQILRQPGEWGISIPGFDSNYLEQRYGSRIDHRILLSFLHSKGFEAQYIDLFSVVGLIFNSSLNRVADFRSPSEIDLDTASDRSRRPGLNHLDGSGLTSYLFQLKNSRSAVDRKRLSSIIVNFRDLSQGADFEVIVQTQRVVQTTSAVVPTAQNASVAPAFPDPQSRVLTIRDTESVALRHRHPF